MHHGTESGIISQVIGNDFAKRFRKQTFIQFADSLVNIFFGGGNPSLVITIRHG
jgi:hypothetical protein